MNIYGIIHNGGDGSACIAWYTKEDMEYLLSDDYEDIEYVYLNEGVPAETIKLPEGMQPSDIGITMSSADRDD
jgi:hypothetical protein